MEIRDRIKTFKRIKASSLTPHPDNPREHPKAQSSVMMAALHEIGYADALVVREVGKGYELLDGHLRAEITPDMKVPCLVVDLDDNEARKFIATHDPIGALAVTDQDALARLTADIEWATDLGEKRLVQFLANKGNPLEGLAEQPVPATPKDPVTKLGDVWLLGNHRIMCGDCRDPSDVKALMDGAPMNLAITSPPYASQRHYDEASEFEPIPPDEYVDWFDAVQANIQEHLAHDGSWFLNIKEHCEDGQRHLYVKDLTLAHVRKWSWRFVDEFAWTHGGTPKAVNQRFKNGWEPIFQFALGRHKFNPDSVMHPTDSAIDFSTGKIKPILGFKENGQVGKTGHPNDENKQGLKFPKGEGMGGKAGLGDAIGAREAGAVVEGLAYPSNVLSLGKNREALGHSAAYPVSLPAFFTKAYSNDGDIIYDPFIGSGSTLIAAEQLDRECYGLEISPAYCDVAVERWENLTGHKAECDVSRRKAAK